MGRKTIPLHFCKVNIPLMMFRLADGKERYAIIDTGSDSTTLSIDLKDHLKTKESDVKTRIIGVNGKSKYNTLMQAATKVKVETDGGEEIEVLLGGVLYDMTAVLSHFQKKNGELFDVSALIGGDFLKYYNAEIDYENKTLTIDGDE